MHHTLPVKGAAALFPLRIASRVRLKLCRHSGILGPLRDVGGNWCDGCRTPEHRGLGVRGAKVNVK